MLRTGFIIIMYVFSKVVLHITVPSRFSRRIAAATAVVYFNNYKLWTELIVVINTCDKSFLELKDSVSRRNERWLGESALTCWHGVNSKLAHATCVSFLPAHRWLGRFWAEARLVLVCRTCSAGSSSVLVFQGADGSSEEPEWIQSRAPCSGR